MASLAGRQLAVPWFGGLLRVAGWLGWQGCCWNYFGDSRSLLLHSNLQWPASTGTRLAWEEYVLLEQFRLHAFGPLLERRKLEPEPGGNSQRAVKTSHARPQDVGENDQVGLYRGHEKTRWKHVKMGEVDDTKNKA